MRLHCIINVKVSLLQAMNIHRGYGCKSPHTHCMALENRRWLAIFSSIFTPRKVQVFIFYFLRSLSALQCQSSHEQVKKKYTPTLAGIKPTQSGSQGQSGHEWVNKNFHPSTARNKTHIEWIPGPVRTLMGEEKSPPYCCPGSNPDWVDHRASMDTNNWRKISTRAPPWIKARLDTNKWRKISIPLLYGIELGRPAHSQATLYI